jgi:DNA-binding protein H-NS
MEAKQMDIKALQEAKAEIEAKIEEARKAAKAGAISQIAALMAEAGLTAADLGFAPQAKKPRKPRESAAPKFVGPEPGQTWVGRGKRPAWLTAAIAAGKPLEAFAVQ